MIVKIERSPLINKRFRVTLDNGEHYDFGFASGNTYIDHRNKTLRENYLKRHMANETENKLITNLVPSPSLFSAMLLWGKYDDLQKNITHLNNLWKKKYGK